MFETFQTRIAEKAKKKKKKKYWKNFSFLLKITRKKYPPFSFKPT